MFVLKLGLSDFFSDEDDLDLFKMILVWGIPMVRDIPDLYSSGIMSFIGFLPSDIESDLIEEFFIFRTIMIGFDIY